MSRQAEAKRWNGFLKDNVKVREEYETLRVQVKNHEAPRQLMQEFRNRYLQDGDFRYVEHGRGHYEGLERSEGWTYRPTTKEQLEFIYKSKDVAAHVIQYLRARQMFRFSAMTGTEVYDHPEYMLDLAKRNIKSLDIRHSSGQMKPGDAAGGRRRPLLALEDGRCPQQPEAGRRCRAHAHAHTCTQHVRTGSRCRISLAQTGAA